MSCDDQESQTLGERIARLEAAAERKEPRSKSFRAWSTFVIAISGAVLAVVGFFQTQTNERTTAQLQADDHLYGAWDLLGGEPGTDEIAGKPDRQSIVLAERLVKKAFLVEPEPHWARPYNVRATLLWAKDDLAGAEEDLREAIRLAPEEAALHANLAIVLAENRTPGKLEEAREALQAANRLEPENDRYRENLRIVSEALDEKPAVPVPMLLGGIQRAKQKRAMADMRTLGFAVEAYAVDTGQYPTSEGWVEVGELGSSLVPEYLQEVPTVDDWGNSILYKSDGDEYSIVSLGRDRAHGGESADADLIFQNGRFVEATPNL